MFYSHFSGGLQTLLRLQFSTPTQDSCVRVSVISLWEGGWCGSASKTGHGGGAVPCSAPVCWTGAGVGEGQAVAGIWLLRELLARCRGIAEVLGLAGAVRGELAEMTEADREHPTVRLGDGWLGWPERRRAVIAATVFAKGFGKPTCCQISAPIIFFKIKGIIFVL